MSEELKTPEQVETEYVLDKSQYQAALELVDGASADEIGEVRIIVRQMAKLPDGLTEFKVKDEQTGEKFPVDVTSIGDMHVQEMAKRTREKLEAQQPEVEYTRYR